MEIFHAALFDELTPVYPDTDPAEGAAVYRTAGANGTYAGVHVVLSGLVPGYPVSVEVRGPHRSYKLFEMAAVPVEVNTGAKLRSEYLKGDVNAYVIRRAPFMVYEALQPIRNIFRPGYTTAALAFKTPIEYCRAPRTQTWELLITHRGMTKQLKFYVDEYPMSVPRADANTFRYVNWFNFEEIAHSHHCEMWSDRYFYLLEKYIRAAVYSRQNVFCIGMPEMFDRAPDGGLRLNRSRLDRLIDTAKRAGIQLFHGGAFASRKEGVADDDDFYRSLDHTAIENPDEIAKEYSRRAFDAFDYGTEAVASMTGEPVLSGNGLQTIADMAGQLYAYLKENKLDKAWTQCCMDEPNPALEKAYRAITETVHRAMPGIPTLEPTLTGHPLEDTMNIWCPSLDHYEKDKAFYDSRVALGEKIWVYTCLTPGGNYCNRLLDMERLRPVWLGWMSVRYPDIEGYLHWGGNTYCEEGPYRRQAIPFAEQVLEFHPKYEMHLPPGDAAIFFPGWDEPLVSTRSEAHRIGLEDLCLLKQLQERDPEKVQALIDRVFRGFADYEKDVAVYRAARRELLEALHAAETEKH